MKAEEEVKKNKWYADVEKAQCIICGAFCEPHEKGFHFCSNCKKLTAGFVLMVCLSCGNFQYFKKTHDVMVKIDNMRREYEVHDVDDCTVIIYDSCPNCYHTQKVH